MALVAIAYDWFTGNFCRWQDYGQDINVTSNPVQQAIMQSIKEDKIPSEKKLTATLRSLQNVPIQNLSSF
jgi:hypothetical protein